MSQQHDQPEQVLIRNYCHIKHGLHLRIEDSFLRKLSDERIITELEKDEIETELSRPAKAAEVLIDFIFTKDTTIVERFLELALPFVSGEKVLTIISQAVHGLYFQRELD
jgi:hypothetical protein